MTRPRSQQLGCWMWLLLCWVSITTAFVLPSPSSALYGCGHPYGRSRPGRVPENDLPPKKKTADVRKYALSDMADTEVSLFDNLDFKTVWDTVTGVGAAVVGVLVLYELYKDIPQGWVDTKLVRVGPSTLGPKVGLGLFADVDIKEGTVLGSYAGIARTKQEWVQWKGTQEACLLATRYIWETEEGIVIDPTGPDGNLREYIGTFPFQKPTLLARVNEPPPGQDTNLIATPASNAVQYVAERDISEGEELFVDYGPRFNRATYRK